MGTDTPNQTNKNSNDSSDNVSGKKLRPRTRKNKKNATADNKRDSTVKTPDVRKNNESKEGNNSKLSQNESTRPVGKTRQKRSKSAKKAKDEGAKFENSSDEPSNKVKIRISGDGGENGGVKKPNRRSRRKRTANDEGTPNPSDTVKMKQLDDLHERRQKEIDQCFHVLGSDGFKLFKNGRYVTTYNIPFNDSTKFTEEDVKFSINVPIDYPKSAIKLSSNKCNSQGQSKDSRLNNVISNFNYKARQLNRQGLPILSQLNYFFEELEFLTYDDYRDLDSMKQKFYAQFC